MDSIVKKTITIEIVGNSRCHFETAHFPLHPLGVIKIRGKGASQTGEIERFIQLNVLDSGWKETGDGWGWNLSEKIEYVFLGKKFDKFRECLCRAESAFLARGSLAFWLYSLCIQMHGNRSLLHEKIARDFFFHLDVAHKLKSWIWHFRMAASGVWKVASFHGKVGLQAWANIYFWYRGISIDWCNVIFLIEMWFY